MAISTYIPYSPPCLDEEEIEAVVETLRSGWITTGPRARQFEEEFAGFLGAPGALALNSCTAALHTALVALGIGLGDEVITTPMTFAASVNVVEHVGAKPVLVDVERDTLNLDPAKVEAAITARTRAILPVHYAGHPADMARLEAVAEQHSLAIVEDAAHALPARDRKRYIGASGNPTAFSFYATKNLTTGEGGMLTGDPAFLARARTISLHGMSRDAWRRYDRGGSWRYEVLLPGFKYNMTDLAAALGLVQLGKLTRFQQRRREIVSQYHIAFSDHPALETPVERPEVEHAWHLYVLRLVPAALRINRDRFLEELTARGVGTSVHFIPIHLHPYYRDKYGLQPTDFPVAYSSYFRLFSLPLHPGLTDDEVGYIIESVLAVAHQHRR